MTIKVCKQKAKDRWNKFAISLLYVGQVALPIWCAIGIYQMITGEEIGLFGAILGSWSGGMLISIGGILDKSPYLKFHRKYKLFEWNNDC